MNCNEYLLLNLLRLHAGRLASKQTQIVSHQIKNDQATRDRWLRVRQTLTQRQQPLPIKSGAISAIAADFQVDPQWIAAYLDESLDLMIAAELQRRAWESNELLREIVDAYQFYVAPPYDVDVPTQLHQRLLDLPSKTATHLPTDTPNLNGHKLTPLASVSTEPESAVPQDKPVAAAPGAGYLNRAQMLMYLAAALVVVGSAITLAWVVSRNSNPNVVQQDDLRSPTLPETPAPGQAPQPELQEDGLVGQPERPDLPTPESRQPNAKQPNELFPESSRDNVKQPQLVDRQPAQPRPAEDMRPDPVNWPDENRRPNEPATATSNTTVPKLDWTSLRGLLTIQDPDNHRSVGVNYSRKMNPDHVLVTMPLSWAKATVEGSDCELVMDANSAAQITTTPDRPTHLRLRLNYGRVALKSLEPGTQLRVVAGPADWNVIVDDEKSSIAVQWFEGAPILLVRTGNVLVDNAPVDNNQQVRWHPGNSQIEKITSDLAWFAKPQNTTRIRQRNVLLASDDVWRDLDTPNLFPGTKSEQLLRVLDWRLTMRPEMAHKFIVGDDSARRELAFEWLMHQPINQRQGALIFQTMARLTGARDKLMAVYRAYHRAQPGELPERAITNRFVEALDDPRPFYRYAACAVLRKITGENPVEYRPNEPRQIRRRKIQQWMMRIQLLYQRRDRARRGG